LRGTPDLEAAPGEGEGSFLSGGSAKPWISEKIRRRTRGSSSGRGKYLYVEEDAQISDGLMR